MRLANLSPARWMLLAVAFTVALPVIGLGVVTAGELVPDRVVLDQLVEDRENTHFGTPTFEPGYAGRTVDKFTDCLALTMGSAPTDRWWPVGSAIASPTFGPCGSTIDALNSYADGGNPPVQNEYYRYWHGYAPVVRPMVALFGVGGTRVVVTALLFGLLIGLARAVARPLGRWVSIALFATLALTTDFVDLAGSLPHGITMLVTLGTAWALFARARVTDDVAVLFFGAWLCGAAVAFVDVFTTPVHGFGLVTLLVGLASINSHGRTGWALARRMGSATAGWVSGWVLMWLGKWVFAGLLFGFGEVRDNVRFSVDFRLAGEHDNVRQTLGYTSVKNVGQWIEPPLTKFVFVILLVVAIAQIVRRRQALLQTLPDRVLLAVPVVAPFVWYELTRNHSQIHSWFTFRSLAGTFGGLTAIVLLELKTRQNSAGST